MFGPFTRLLIEANRLRQHGFHSWVLLPGMEFGAAATWWGRAAARPRPHEGIDLHTFRDRQGQEYALGAGALIPALFPGELVAIFPDFLGHSLLMAHDRHIAGGRLHTIIAHVRVEPGIVCGRRYRAGAIVARIAPSARAGVPPHLHLTTFALSGPIPDPITWPSLVSGEGVHWLDPGPWLGASPLQSTGAG